MTLFRNGMNIGKDNKYDLTQVSAEGITQEELEEIEKKNQKLINIYKAFGATAAGMKQLDLAKAMDAFQDADENNDGELSNKELENFA